MDGALGGYSKGDIFKYVGVKAWLQQRSLGETCSCDDKNRYKKGDCRCTNHWRNCVR